MSHEMKCTWPSCSHTAKDQCRTDWVLRSEAHISARAADADTITALRAENERLKTSGIAEVAAHNPSVMDYMRHWGGRAEKAEAEVERLRAALENVMVGGNHLVSIMGVPHPAVGMTPEYVLSHYGPGHQYDAWCCWNAVMLACAALEKRT